MEENRKYADTSAKIVRFSLSFGFTVVVFWALYGRTYGKKVDLQELDFPNVRIEWQDMNHQDYHVVKTLLRDECSVKLKSPKLNQEQTELKIQYSFSADDFRKVSDGKLQVEITKENIMIKDGRTWKRASDPDWRINELSVLPASFSVEVQEWLENKTVAIKPEYNSDELPEGCVLDDIKTENKNGLYLSGPKSELDKIVFIRTKPISLKDKTENFTRTIELESPQNKDVEYSFSSVSVSVRISKQKIFSEKYTYTLSILETTSQNRKLKLAESVQLPNIILTVSSPNPDLSKEWFHPYIDISSVSKPGVYTIPVKYWSEQSNANVKDCSEKSVSITLESIDK